MKMVVDCTIILVLILYFYSSGIFATAAPIAAAPLIGFGELAAQPLSLIDFHGIQDDVIPYSPDQADGIHFYKISNYVQCTEYSMSKNF
jgi:poly(3-hydroxybutyrate) depolymerase